MSGRQHRVLITGATGFVGGWLQKELAARSDDIEIVAAGYGSGSTISLDLANYRGLVDLIERCRPTAVVHLAAIAAPMEAGDAPRRAWAVNADGTANIAWATLEAAPDARFVFAGSSEVYGSSFVEAAGAPITETASLQPTNIYGATKAAADILVGQMAHDGLKSIRFRPFNHAGPGQTDAFVVPAFARQLAEIAAGNRPAVISVGNLSAKRDFLDVRDVVRAYADAALLDRPETVGRVFNLASGIGRSIEDILSRLIAVSGQSVSVEVDPERFRAVDVPAATGSAEAIAQHGWRPEIDFDRTLADVFADWQRIVRSS